MDGEPRILRTKLSPEDLLTLAEATFGDMVKLVVDVDRGLLAAGGMLHADAEALLTEDGAPTDALWGANYFPARAVGERLEYTALINIRPARGNRGQEIADPSTRERVREVVERLVGPA